MNEYSKHYSEIDNYKLIKILRSSENYNEEAIAAAKLELNKRNLEIFEIESIESELEKAEKTETIKIEKIKKMKSDLTKSVSGIKDSINPVLSNKDIKTGNRFKWIIYSFSAIFIFRLISEFKLLYHVFGGGFGEYDFSIIFYAMPILLLLSGIICFWKRLKIGWILLTFYVVFFIVEKCITIKYILSNSLAYEFELEGLEDVYIVDAPDNNFLMNPDFGMTTVMLIMYIGFLVALLSKQILSVLKLEIGAIIITIGMSAIFSILIILEMG